jgi:hypothetical protein
VAVSSARPSPFDQVFDAVVVGSGHAGYAATLTLRRQGRSVLLIGPRGDLVWESGRTFCPDAGNCDDPEWSALVRAVAQRGGLADGWLDGAITEVVATDRLRASGAAVLYYARPVAVERSGDAVASILVATKSGLRRVAGRQWVDATESGELLHLLHPDLTAREPITTHAYLMLQHPDWSRAGTAPGLRSTAWPTERVLPVEVKHDDPAWREQLLSALAELERTLGDEIAAVSLSHLSIEPISRYGAGDVTRPAAANVVGAASAFAAAPVTTLADRFMLGADAAAALREQDVYGPSEDILSLPLPRVEPARAIRADVCVAGAGTGGALAALAAAKAGARVVCVEPLAFVGGIGTGGGIHGYWYGVAGGLQQQVDRRTRELMKERFAGGPLGDGPFNPWAKMIALEQMLRGEGIALHTDGLVFGVEADRARVTAALVATPAGVLRVDARAFVDGTGDGDLCALAGADFTYGREHDGLLHAYSQSSGRLRELHGRPRMAVVNFDAGFCDPTDPEDITRARLVGVRQYLLDSYDNLSRPTYIAPALGLRQARQVVTDYVLTLDDQIRRRRFDDPIGYTGAHYDNHATDYEFESDEAVFWVWLNRQWHLPIACEMSYRMLVPRGLDNVWIASRCLGLSQDAHYSSRMERDIQRVGEAAGFAAAEAAKRGADARQLPYSAVRRWLDQTGALQTKPRNLDSDFGTYPSGGYDYGGAPIDPGALVAPDEQTAAKALAALDRGEPGEEIWWLHRHEPLVRDAVIERLPGGNAGGPMVSWLAAGIVAMWNDRLAEPRLIDGIESREYGFGDPYPAERRKDHSAEPLEGSKLVPNWLCAVTLLRRCGTDACLPALARLVDLPVHGINTLTSVAITLERLVRRGDLRGGDARARVEAILDRILAVEVVGTIDYPARDVGRYSEQSVHGDTKPADTPARLALAASARAQLRNTYEDNRWQLHLAVARARAALGLPVDDLVAPYHADNRALVRRAFAAVTPAPAPAGDRTRGDSHAPVKGSSRSRAALARQPDQPAVSTV